jgi:dipeptidyl aminopeptidase/acylaminoacyl peptidase
LAFTADEQQRDEHSYERADLRTVTLDGVVSRLTDDGFDYRSPAWSPDGGWIAVRGGEGLDVVIRERWDHGAASDIFLVSADGTRRRNLTGDFDLMAGSPEWSSDGRWIYFTADVGGATHLFRADVTTGTVSQMTRGAVRVGGVSFSADHGRYAYVVEHPTDPGNVYVADVAAPGALALDGRRLTDMNAGLLAALELQAPERVVFDSPDGSEVEGWVLPPVGYRPDGGPYPLILNIHGGPHGSYGWDFAFDRHLQSAKGYLVLFINPRASTGYGEDFRWGTWGSWGDEDYEDLMAGVDHVLDRFPVDEARLGVTGYSYGGYMTNWIITRKELICTDSETSPERSTGSCGKASTGSTEGHSPIRRGAHSARRSPIPGGCSPRF